MERARFRGKEALSVLMLVPLVIPGVILGISILLAVQTWRWFRDGALDMGFETIFTQDVDDKALVPDFRKEVPFEWS